MANLEQAILSDLERAIINVLKAAGRATTEEIYDAVRKMRGFEAVTLKEVAAAIGDPDYPEGN